MARLLDELADSDDLAKAKDDPLASVLSKEAAPAKAPTTPQAEDRLLGDDVPEKYRGKGAKDLLEIIQNQERLIGRHSQEVGQLRQETQSLRGLVDKALQFKGAGDTGHSPNREDVALTGDELLKRPVESVTRVAERAVQPVAAKVEALEANLEAQRFAGQYPSALQDLEDPKFMGWVEKSPYRQRLVQRAFADKSRIDWAAAEELWMGYEEIRSSAGAASAAPNTGKPTPNRSQPEDVSLVAGGGAGGGGTEVQSGAVEQFSERKLIEMQEKNPELYWSPAIQQRIARGRVIRDL